MTDDLTPTLADRLTDPKTVGMLVLGTFGLGILLGWKLAGGERIVLEQPFVEAGSVLVDAEPTLTADGFPFIPPYNAADASEMTEE